MEHDQEATNPEGHPATLDQQAVGELEALRTFVETTRLEYAYQMLLLLVMLSQADEQGTFSLKATADRFARFYRARAQAGRPVEKARGEGKKQAAVDARQLSGTIRSGPYPRFNRQGFLSLQSGPDGACFVTSAHVQQALTLDEKAALRNLAIERLARHFQEERNMMERFVQAMDFEHE